MASLLLMVGGAILGGGAGIIGGMIGAAIGGMIGSYVDQMFLFPVLFGSPKMDAPKIDDIQLQTASEGTPIKFVLGEQNRIAGNVLWISPIREEEEKIGGGGCRGGDGTNYYEYFCDVAIGICEGEIVDIKRIWLNGNLLADLQGNNIVDINNDALELQVYTTGGGIFGDHKYIVVHTHTKGLLDDFISGTVLNMTGWVIVANNLIDIPCIQVRLSADPYFIKFEVPMVYLCLAEVASGVINLHQVKPKKNSNYIEDVIIYNGADNQAADSLIIAAEGAENTPTFRGIAYAVFENMNITKFGNYIPSITFEVAQSIAAMSVADAFGALFERAELTSEQYDVSTLSGTMRGHAIGGIQAMTESLRQAAHLYDVIFQETAGRFVLKHKSNLVATVILETDLAPREGGSDTPKFLEISDVFNADLPRDISINYIDYDSDYENSCERAQNVTAGSNTSAQADIMFTLISSEAKAFADKQLWELWTNRQTVKFTLPPKYIFLGENDLVTLNIETEAYTILLSKVQRGYNYLIQCEGYIEKVSTCA